MSFEILPPAPVATATVAVSYEMLHRLLRLPHDILITAVSPGIPGVLTLQLIGNVPAGEVTANYSYEHFTNIKFVGFEQP